jgi:hypothetical protein
MINTIQGKQTIATLVALSLGQMLLLPSVLAETVTRAEGRCKLTINKSTAYDGHCTFKHKERDNKQVFSINLDSGQSYKIQGTSLDALQVEDYSGLHNVKFSSNDGGDKDVFAWSSQGSQNRLVVKLDRQTPANVSTSSAPSNASPDLGTVIGAGLGALLGSLISGGGSSSQPATTTVVVGQSVPELSDLVGARGGQAEGTLQQRGYVFIKATQQADSAYSNWKSSKTGNCVAIRTTDGRYAAIVYAPASDCNR